MVTIKGITHVAQPACPTPFNSFQISSAHPIIMVNGKSQFNYEVELNILTNTPQNEVSAIAPWFSFEGPGCFIQGQTAVSVKAQSAIYRCNQPDEKIVPHEVKIFGFFNVISVGSQIKGTDPEEVNSCSFTFSLGKGQITPLGMGPGDTVWISGVLRKKTCDEVCVDAIFIASLDELYHALHI
ncbi:hypothetical protein PCASD_19519 [Puccinia coronata f. sp. avenae]|uniref:Uncharacterized protein n=1 Tax=Puccinia coronata f. sp. avenae TaxID=200324 RepID=A0A2N5TPM8_9BASI|nr:hypothetical protein PCASD_19519 [Puccinia coronata f. sp. avenae]